MFEALVDSENYKRMRKTDIQLVLRPIDDKAPKSSTGLVDTSLFTGGNTLHVIKEDQTGFWFFQYENGILPQPLKQKFTNYNKALQFATEYFRKRNIKIAEELD